MSKRRAAREHAPHQHNHDDGVEDELGAVGGHQPGHVEASDKRQREQEVDADGRNTDDLRRFGVLACVVGEDQRLIEGGEQRAGQVDQQRDQDLDSGVVACLAVLEHQLHRRPRKHRQPERRRDDQHGNHPQAVRERAPIGFVVAGREVARQSRK